MAMTSGATAAYADSETSGSAAAQAEESAASAESTAPSVPKGVKTTSLARGVRITWKSADNATGYRVYRAEEGSQSFTRLVTITNNGRVWYMDSTAESGVKYVYQVRARGTANGKTVYSEPSATSSPAFVLGKPQNLQTEVSQSESGASVLRVSWDEVSGATGYTVEYAANTLFLSSTTLENTTNVFLELEASPDIQAKYLRVKATNGKVASGWSETAEASSDLQLSLTQAKTSKSKAVELFGLAKQSFGAYDTLQGACSDGKYMYYVLLNQGKENCKIAKVQLSTGKLKKVSSVLSVGHGNDITYNPDTKKLIVANCRVKPWALSIVNPSTLKAESTKTIKLPALLTGAKASELKASTGITAIAYSPEKQQYIAMVGGCGQMVIISSKFKATEMLPLTYKSPHLNQSLEAAGDYILFAESYASGASGNIISVYDWEGTYIKQFKVMDKYEIESVFMSKGDLYVGFYRSYTKTVNKKPKFWRANYYYKVKSF